jgi:hypothetical protein
MHSEQAKNKKTQRVHEHDPAKEQKNGPPAKNKPPEVDPATSCVEHLMPTSLKPDLLVV